MDCIPGHIKHNPATFEVAVRTTFQATNDKLAQMLWLKSSPSQGAKYVGDDYVEGWLDLWTAEPQP